MNEFSSYIKHKYNKTPKPHWVNLAVSDNVKTISAMDWIDENYLKYTGDTVKDFNGIQNEISKKWVFDKKLVDNWYVRFDVMYKIYKDGGGKNSQTKFGNTLTQNGVFSSPMKLNGKKVVVRVGISLRKQDIFEFI